MIYELLSTSLGSGHLHDSQDALLYEYPFIYVYDEPYTAGILSGPGLIYIAPLGSALPAPTWPIVWPPGWFRVGYTDAGIDCVYTPTIGEFYVDEEFPLGTRCWRKSLPSRRTWRSLISPT